MSSADTTKPAFPRSNEMGDGVPGMTMLEWYTGQALIGILAGLDREMRDTLRAVGESYDPELPLPDVIAAVAREQAEAVIRILATEPTDG